MRRAFSLIELLLSVFILAIGIISISALFPAGIAQQQLANDDQIGPMVAEHAIGTLRSRLRQEDFGTFEEYGVFNLLQQSTDNGSYVFRPAPGDWSWMRPAVITTNVPGTVPDDTGALDVFAAGATPPNTIGELTEFPGGVTSGNGTLFGMPYNSAASGFPPAVIITQRERWWPTVPEGQAVTQPSPYCWDVMFRRFGGKVQVAVFVYRVVGVGGAARSYVAKANPAGSSQPPVPFRRVLTSLAATADQASTGSPGGLQVRVGWQQPGDPIPLANPAFGPWATGLIGTSQGLLAADYPAAALVPVQNTWQFPGQWLLDANGNILKVTQGRRTSVDPVQVRLSNPIPRVPTIQSFDDYERPSVGTNDPVPQGIRALFFVPAYDADRNQLIPVYCTVRDL
jgi:hypothetical protein